MSGPEGGKQHLGRVCFEGGDNVAYGLGEVMRWHRPTPFVTPYMDFIVLICTAT